MTNDFGTHCSVDTYFFGGSSAVLPGVVRVHRKLFKVNAHEFINGTSRILHNYEIL